MRLVRLPGGMRVAGEGARDGIVGPCGDIRCGTCGNSDKCDYLIVGSKNEMTAEYETVTDEQGFLVSRRIEQKN